MPSQITEIITFTNASLFGPTIEVYHVASTDVTLLPRKGQD